MSNIKLCNLLFENNKKDNKKLEHDDRKLK